MRWLKLLSLVRKYDTLSARERRPVGIVAAWILGLIVIVYSSLESHRSGEDFSTIMVVDVTVVIILIAASFYVWHRYGRGE